MSGKVINKSVGSNMLLSIIIPVYNTEKTVRQCLAGVLACNLDQCELLLVTGSSTDHSDQICAEYAKRYPFVRIIPQNGKGLSNARNSALCVAAGEYILFLDSDDTVDSEILDQLLTKLRNGSYATDVVVTDYRRVEYPSGKIRPFFQIGADTPVQYRMDFLPSMLTKRQSFWNVWRYIYRREFLTEHQIYFMENSLSEDIDFTVNIFLAEPEIIFDHSPYYFYHVGRGGSLMDQFTLQRLKETVFVLRNSVNRLRGSSFVYADLIAAQLQFEYILNLALTVEIAQDDQEKAMGLFSDWKTVLADSCDPIVRTLRFGISLLGLKQMAYCLHVAKLIKRRAEGRQKRG